MKNESKQTWHNSVIDKNGGVIYVEAIRQFIDHSGGGERIVNRGDLLGLDANYAYKLYRDGFVTIPRAEYQDPKIWEGAQMDNRRRTLKSWFDEQEPTEWTTTHFHGVEITVPVDGMGDPYRVKLVKGEDGKPKLDFVPIEGHTQHPRLAPKYPLISDDSPVIKARDEETGIAIVTENAYIYESGEYVQTNLMDAYTDFFSRRLYQPGNGQFMYPEEAERAKAEGKATDEEVVEIFSLADTTVEHDGVTRKYLANCTYLAPASVADELEDELKAVRKSFFKSYQQPVMPVGRRIAMVAL